MSSPRASFSGAGSSRRGERGGRSGSGGLTRGAAYAGRGFGSSLFVSDDESDEEDISTLAGKLVFVLLAVILIMLVGISAKPC